MAGGHRRCVTETCQKDFPDSRGLWRHYHEMGVPGFDQVPPSDQPAVEATASTESAAFAPPPRGGSIAAPLVQNDNGEGHIDQDLAVCSVCMDNPPNVVMVPCGHFFACEPCGRALQSCAICRADVKQVLRIYY